jgi:hypothetical protein
MPMLLYWRLSGHVSQSKGAQKTLPPLGFNPQTVHNAESHYINHPRPSFLGMKNCNMNFKNQGRSGKQVKSSQREISNNPQTSVSWFLDWSLHNLYLICKFCCQSSTMSCSSCSAFATLNWIIFPMYLTSNIPRITTKVDNQRTAYNNTCFYSQVAV